MSNLKWELKKLARENHNSGMGTLNNRVRIFSQVSDQLRKLGYNQMNFRALKAKHVNALVKQWQSENITAGTMKNRLSHIRWWAKQINASHKIPNNTALGIDKRIYVTNINKAIALTQTHLDKVNDPLLKLSLRLQNEFGLRREEALKFNVYLAQQKHSIILKDTWCKGKRSREISITTELQKVLLADIKKEVGKASLIPINKQYVYQMNQYANTVRKDVIGIEKGHGLRHNYAQNRYKALSGNECPVRGGMRQKSMNKEERQFDKAIRLQISKELGHAREQITSIYLGS